MAEAEKPKPALQVIVLGAGGGPQESNTTAFLVRSIAQGWSRGSVIAVDGGVFLSVITKLLRDYMPHPLPSRPFTITDGPFSGLSVPYLSAEANAGYITSTLIDAHVITHPHLDHISGFVMNTAGPPGTRPKKLAALPNTIHAFKTHIFNEVIWPNLSDENGGAGLVTYLRLVEGGSPAMGEGDVKGYSELCDGLLVKAWSVSHGVCVEKQGRRNSVSSNSTRFSSHDAAPQSSRREHQLPHQQAGARRASLLSQVPTPSVFASPPPGDGDRSTSGVVESSAYFIQDRETGREILMFGDVEPDSISLSPRNAHVWREAAPKVVAKTLAAVFIECSYDSTQSNDRLFGHLKPEFLMQELSTLAEEVGRARKELRVAESRKRKRASVTADDVRRESTPRQSMTLTTEMPLSPKSTMAKMAAAASRGIDSPTASRPETPHIATPTERLSIGDMEALNNPTVSPTGQLEGLKVVIIHVKETLQDGPSRRDLIMAELRTFEADAGLGCKFVMAHQGMSLYL